MTWSMPAWCIRSSRRARCALRAAPTMGGRPTQVRGIKFTPNRTVGVTRVLAFPEFRSSIALALANGAVLGEERIPALDDLRVTHDRVTVQTLEAKLVVKRPADYLENCLLRRLHRDPRVTQDLGGHVLRRRHQVLARHDTVDQMAFLRALGRNGFAHQFQLHGDADATGVDQPHDPAVGEMHAPAHVVETELGVIACHPDVTRQRQLDPAAHYLAVQGGDDRLAGAMQSAGDPAGETSAEHLTAQIGPARGPAVDVGLQIGAGAERLFTVSRQDCQPHIGVLPEPRPRLEQLLLDVVVDGVELLRAIQCDISDLATLLVQYLRFS